MRHDDKHVITGEAIILWDGITKPDTELDPANPKYNLKVVVPANAPELTELNEIAVDALNNSEFRGQLPPGANWPFANVDHTKAGLETLQGYISFTGQTRLGPPQILDINGNELASLTYARQLYPGAKVKLLVHAFAYNNKQKGIALGLDGVQIIDATGPALAVGGGMSAADVAGAFGAAPGAPAPGAPAPGAPAPGAPAPGAPAPGAPAPGAPAPGAPAPAPGAPAPGAPAPGAPAPGAPAPAPAREFIAPPPAPAPTGPQMTPAANGVPYQSYIQEGWTDEQLRANGLML